MLFLPVSVSAIDRQLIPQRSDIIMIDTWVLSSDEDLRSQNVFLGFYTASNDLRPFTAN